MIITNFQINKLICGNEIRLHITYSWRVKHTIKCLIYLIDIRVHRLTGNRSLWFVLNQRLIKTQIGHARDFTWYRGQRPSHARVILSHERVQIYGRENLCSYATNPPHFSVRELLLCDVLITRAGDGHWPRYQAKSLACTGCVLNLLGITHPWNITANLSVSNVLF